MQRRIPSNRPVLIAGLETLRVGTIESVVVKADKGLHLPSVSGGLPQPIGDYHVQITVYVRSVGRTALKVLGCSYRLAVLENEYIFMF